MKKIWATLTIIGIAIGFFVFHSTKSQPVLGDAFLSSVRKPVFFVVNTSTASALSATSSLFVNRITSTFEYGFFHVDSAGNTSVSGTLNVFGATTLQGGLTVTGACVGCGGGGAGGITPFSPTSTFVNNISVTNGISTSSLAANSLAIATSTANPSGIFNVDSGGNVSVSGTLFVNGSINSTTSLSVASSTINASGLFNVDSTGKINSSSSITVNPYIIFNGGVPVDPTKYEMGKSGASLESFGVPAGGTWSFLVNGANVDTISNLGLITMGAGPGTGGGFVAKDHSDIFDNTKLSFGTNADNSVPALWGINSSFQTGMTLMIMTGNSTNSTIVGQNGKQAINLSLPVFANPTMVFESTNVVASDNRLLEISQQVTSSLFQNVHGPMVFNPLSSTYYYTSAANPEGKISFDKFGNISTSGTMSVTSTLFLASSTVYTSNQNIIDPTQYSIGRAPNGAMTFNNPTNQNWTWNSNGVQQLLLSNSGVGTFTNGVVLQGGTSNIVDNTEFYFGTTVNNVGGGITNQTTSQTNPAMTILTGTGSNALMIETQAELGTFNYAVPIYTDPTIYLLSASAVANDNRFMTISQGIASSTITANGTPLQFMTGSSTFRFAGLAPGSTTTISVTTTAATGGVEFVLRVPGISGGCAVAYITPGLTWNITAGGNKCNTVSSSFP